MRRRIIREFNRTASAKRNELSNFVSLGQATDTETLSRDLFPNPYAAPQRLTAIIALAELYNLAKFFFLLTVTLPRPFYSSVV